MHFHFASVEAGFQHIIFPCIDKTKIGFCPAPIWNVTALIKYMMREKYFYIIFHVLFMIASLGTGALTELNKYWSSSGYFKFAMARCWNYHSSSSE